MRKVRVEEKEKEEKEIKGETSEVANLSSHLQFFVTSRSRRGRY